MMPSLPTCPRVVLCRAAAAAYVGVSAGTFDSMVAEGQMPAAWRIGSRLVWDLRRLDAALDELPHAEDAAMKDTAPNGWDQTCQP